MIAPLASGSGICILYPRYYGKNVTHLSTVNTVPAGKAHGCKANVYLVLLTLFFFRPF